MHDWQKFWKRFRGSFVFESRVSTKTVVKSDSSSGLHHPAFEQLFFFCLKQAQKCQFATVVSLILAIYFLEKKGSLRFLKQSCLNVPFSYREVNTIFF